MTLWEKGFERRGLTWKCNDCSAVVASREDHTDWHRRLLAALHGAVMA